MSSSEKQVISKHIITETAEDIFDIIELLENNNCKYKALDKRSGEFVSIEIISPGDCHYDDYGFVDNGIKLLKSMQSEYIVNFKESLVNKTKHGNKMWIVMEHCCIGSVKEIMSATQKPLKEEEIKIIIKETLMGLKYLHSHNIIHKDIKAEHIMINDQVSVCKILVTGYIHQYTLKYNHFIPPELIPVFMMFYNDTTGMIKLTGFGIRKFTNSTGDQIRLNSVENKNLIAPSMNISAHWMSPEMLTSDTFDCKSDIWSLGITAIEMATGQPPHFDKHPFRVLFLIGRDNKSPTLPQHGNWTDDFRDFVSKCLMNDAKMRPSAQELLNHRWYKNNDKNDIEILHNLSIIALPLIEKMRSKYQNDYSYYNEDELNNDDIIDYEGDDVSHDTMVMAEDVISPNIL